jgi:hypothetical protein
VCTGRETGPWIKHPWVVVVSATTSAAIEITATTRVEGKAGSGTFSTGVRKHTVVAGPEDGGHRDTHAAARSSTSTTTCYSLRRLMKWLRSVKSKSPKDGQVENQINAR